MTFPDADEVAHPSAVAKLTTPSLLKASPAPTDILARSAASPLPYDNRTAGNQLSAKDLDAKTLRVESPVFRTAFLFVCHITSLGHRSRSPPIP